MSTPQKRTFVAHGSGKKRTSAEQVKIRVLKFLVAQNGSDDFAGCTKNQLMHIEGMPTQNWKRFTELLKEMVAMGLVDEFRTVKFPVFRIAKDGEKLVHDGVEKVSSLSEL